MDNKIIRVSCDVSESAHLDELHPLQGELKSLSETSYAKLKRSIIKHGIHTPIYVWDNGTRYNILDGHQRKLTFQSMEGEGYHLPKIPIVIVRAPSLKEAKEILLTMVSQYGKVEKQGLYEYMVESDLDIEFMDDELDLPGIDQESFKVEFFKYDDHSDVDEDEVPEITQTPRSQIGDIYELGNHRLMCGDSTNIDDIEKLMNGEKADITFTSPPYNIDKSPNGDENKYLTYQDDLESEDYKRLLEAFTTNCLAVSDYVFVNIQSLAGNKVALIEFIYALKEKYGDTIIWDKETSEPAMAHRVLNSQFEYIHIFSNEAKRTIGRRDFRGTISNVFRLNSRCGKEYAQIHKATFRVEFPQFFIENFTESSCLDPFGGTGTTMIACEKTKRKCFMMELDTHYCDVIVSRYLTYVGKTKVIKNGIEVDWEMSNLEENVRSI